MNPRTPGWGRNSVGRVLNYIASTKPRSHSSAPNDLGMVAHEYKPRTQKSEAGDQAGLRTCLKKEEIKIEEEERVKI